LDNINQPEIVIEIGSVPRDKSFKNFGSGFIIISLFNKKIDQLGGKIMIVIAGIDNIQGALIFAASRFLTDQRPGLFGRK